MLSVKAHKHHLQELTHVIYGIVQGASYRERGCMEYWSVCPLTGGSTGKVSYRVYEQGS